MSAVVPVPCIPLASFSGSVCVLYPESLIRTWRGGGVQIRRSGGVGTVKWGGGNHGRQFDLRIKRVGQIRR